MRLVLCELRQRGGGHLSHLRLKISVPRLSQRHRAKRPSNAIRRVRLGEFFTRARVPDPRDADGGAQPEKRPRSDGEHVEEIPKRRGRFRHFLLARHVPHHRHAHARSERVGGSREERRRVADEPRERRLRARLGVGDFFFAFLSRRHHPLRHRLRRLHRHAHLRRRDARRVVRARAPADDGSKQRTPRRRATSLGFVHPERRDGDFARRRLRQRDVEPPRGVHAKEMREGVAFGRVHAQSRGDAVPSHGRGPRVALEPHPERESKVEDVRVVLEHGAGGNVALRRAALRRGGVSLRAQTTRGRAGFGRERSLGASRAP